MPTKKTDPATVQAYALVPEILADADRRCLKAFGRAPFPPGTVVTDRESGRTGIVRGPVRVSSGIMAVVDFPDEPRAWRWAHGLDPDGSRTAPHASALYRNGASGTFWHAGFEWHIWRHAKGSHAWDVVRQMPGGTPVDDRCFAARAVRGRMEDVWEAAVGLLDAARVLWPSPYEAA